MHVTSRSPWSWSTITAHLHGSVTRCGFMPRLRIPRAAARPLDVAVLLRRADKTAPTRALDGAGLQEVDVLGHAGTSRGSSDEPGSGWLEPGSSTPEGGPASLGAAFDARASASRTRI